MKIMKTNTVVAVAALVGIAATLAWGLYTSSPTYVYNAVTLTAASTRTDTVVVSDVSRMDKPDEFLLELSGTSQATTADSQFSAVVKSIKNGAIRQIGTDSLFMRPRLTTPGTVVGQQRRLAWVSDSLRITTRNPRSTTVTGAMFSVQARKTQ